MTDQPDENEGLTDETGGATVPAASEASAAEPEVEGDAEGSGPSEEGELQDPEEEPETPSPESEEEPAAPEAPAADELKQLREELAASRAERMAMLELLRAQKQTPAAPPPADPTADVPDDAIRMALFGDTTGKWQTLPADVQSKALKIAQDHVSREIKAARNPNTRVEGLRSELDRAISAAVSPLMEDYHSRRAREISEKHLKVLDPAVERRARELFPSMPGATSANWSEIEKAVKAAATAATAEHYEKAAKAEENKAKAAKVQKTTVGNTKLKPAAPSSGATKPGKIPPMKPNERISDYAERIKSLLG